MPPTRKPHREARFQKRKTTDLAPWMLATGMNETQERRGAWFGLCLSLAPLVIIGLILLLQYLV
ncbi:hypothetical protein [Halomonas sp. RT37]|uniref:Uncharacterized protein n=1 Tax=Halomonas sp. RT37 TaxID=2950872 RepID=A0AAU7KJT8_9GAMM